MKITLANPRGFCAGVDRAILIVEKALEKYGPVYVRHEIVHNRYVVEMLKKKGAIFVEEIHQIPPESIVIFSAHGVSKDVYHQANHKQLIQIDATCPLVKKVHKSIERHHQKAIHTLLIGHKNHPEVEGTMGQLSSGNITLIESVQDVQRLRFPKDSPLAYTSQTTLSVQETTHIIDALKKKYPQIQGPPKGDICYATTNRQQAVEAMVKQVDLLLIIGSKNSSNSNRLKELGQEHGIPSYLIDTSQEAQHHWFQNAQHVGISSGASAPDNLVQDLLSWIKEHYSVSQVDILTFTEENVTFNLPKELH